MKTQEIGRHFDKDEKGQTRRYWFVGGFAAGVAAIGVIQQQGVDYPDVAMIAAGIVLITTLIAQKKWHGWDV